MLRQSKKHLHANQQNTLHLGGVLCVFAIHRNLGNRQTDARRIKAENDIQWITIRQKGEQRPHRVQVVDFETGKDILDRRRPEEPRHAREDPVPDPSTDRSVFLGVNMELGAYHHIIHRGTLLLDQPDHILRRPLVVPGKKDHSGISVIQTVLESGLYSATVSPIDRMPDHLKPGSGNHRRRTVFGTVVYKQKVYPVL